MWRPISSVNGRFAVPLKSLKRLSSLRLRLRLRSGASLASFAFAAASAAANCAASLAADCPPSCCLSSAVTVDLPASIFDCLQAGWLWATVHCSLTTETWLGDQDSNLDKCLQRA